MFKTKTSVLKHRILVTCFATVMLFLSMTAMSVPHSSAIHGATAPPAAVAPVGPRLWVYYFTDATHSTECGYKIVYCNGQVYQTGCVTQFEEHETFQC
jgi:hypothetical protein